MSLPQLDIFELRLGIFTTPQGLTGVQQKVATILTSELSTPQASPGNWTMTVSTFHAELPTQWTDEHPGQSSGERHVYELRVGIYSDPQLMHHLLKRLTQAAGKDLEHNDLCAIPWFANFVIGDDDQHRTHLESRYAHLRSGNKNNQNTSETTSPYIALLVYESASNAPDYEPLYEETVTLIFAASEKEATMKAKQYGAGRETHYENEAGETITWKLKHIVDVSAITEIIGDGTEIYTRHFRNFDAYQKFETQLSNKPL